VGEWWSPLILRDVTYGVRRFAEIQADLGISANVLADRLESLVREGLLETRLYQRRPERHEYVLTEKGADLAPALIALMQWGDRWKWKGGVARCRCCTRTAVTRSGSSCAASTAGARWPVDRLRARARRGVTKAPTGDAPVSSRSAADLIARRSPSGRGAR